MKWINSSRLRLTFAAALVLTLAGCSGPRRYPVEGTVQYEDGSAAKEVAGGTVSLESVADQSNAAGDIQPDGKFKIRDPFGNEGVRAGAYRVIVMPREGADRSNLPVDPKYFRYETSGLEIQVKEEANSVTIKVRRPSKRG